MDNPFGKITSLEEVLQYFHNGSSIMFGGFGGVGSPPTIIDGIIILLVTGLPTKIGYKSCFCYTFSSMVSRPAKADKWYANGVKLIG